MQKNRILESDHDQETQTSACANGIILYEKDSDCSFTIYICSVIV